MFKAKKTRKQRNVFRHFRQKHADFKCVNNENVTMHNNN